MAQRRFGIKQLQINGVVFLAKGGVNYSLGGEKLESVMGVDGRHGVTVKRIPAFVEVTITDSGTDFDLRALTHTRDATVTVDLENGKTITLGHADYVAEGTVSAEEGEVEARFEADPENAEEI